MRKNLLVNVDDNNITSQSENCRKVGLFALTRVFIAVLLARCPKCSQQQRERVPVAINIRDNLGGV